MFETEHVTELMGHDMATPHQKVLLRIWVIDSIEGWVIPTEGERANTNIVGRPTEAEVPACAWV